MPSLLTYLLEEKRSKRRGGLYHKTQVHLAYNSNRIEGSKLTEEQTRYIFETRAIGLTDQDSVPVDDIIETSNHFTAFDYLLETATKPLANTIIKEFHRLLKSATSDSAKPWFVVGGWKKLANEVGGAETTPPGKVNAEMLSLNRWYNSLSSSPSTSGRGAGGEGLPKANVTFEHIVEYHHRFETIHPFQDGNGRVGRLILFRECLRNNITPFIIDDTHKQFYYRGLREFAATPGYLLDTCRSAQDTYTSWINYFYPGAYSPLNNPKPANKRNNRTQLKKQNQFRATRKTALKTAMQTLSRFAPATNPPTPS